MSLTVRVIGDKSAQFASSAVENNNPVASTTTASTSPLPMSRSLAYEVGELGFPNQSATPSPLIKTSPHHLNGADASSAISVRDTIEDTSGDNKNSGERSTSGSVISLDTLRSVLFSGKNLPQNLILTKELEHFFDELRQVLCDFGPFSLPC